MPDNEVQTLLSLHETEEKQCDFDAVYIISAFTLTMCMQKEKGP